MGEPKTVKVRVPVIVRTNGSWHAWGDSSAEDSTAAREASFDGTWNRHGQLAWLTAELPVPTETEVEADVEDDPHA